MMRIDPRARIEAADAALLLIGFGIVTMMMHILHDAALLAGAIGSYAGLIVALWIIPMEWDDD